MYEDDPFSKAVAQATLDLAKKEHMTIVLDEAYSGSTTDFGPIISKIIASKADALLGGGHYADGSTLARQLHDQKTNLKWATLLVAPDSPKFAELGAAATNISVPSQWEPQVKFKPDFGPTAQEFTKDFNVQYGVDPGYHAAGGYAAGLILQHAIEQANSIDPAKVAAELTRLTSRQCSATPNSPPTRRNTVSRSATTCAGAVADEGRRADQRSDLAGSRQDRRYRDELTRRFLRSERTRSST